MITSDTSDCSDNVCIRSAVQPLTSSGLLGFSWAYNSFVIEHSRRGRQGFKRPRSTVCTKARDGHSNVVATGWANKTMAKGLNVLW